MKIWEKLSNGKVLYVLTLDGGKWLIAAEAVVPNLSVGYGPLGTASQVQKNYGILGLRSLSSLPTLSELKSRLVNTTDQQILAAVEAVNEAWQSGEVDRLDALIDKGGAFSIGDFGAFYLAGESNLHQHFVDFYRTSKVNSIKIGTPSIKAFGNIGVAAFQFDTVLRVSGKETHSSGQGMYVFRNNRGKRLADGGMLRKHARST